MVWVLLGRLYSGFFSKVSLRCVSCTVLFVIVYTYCVLNRYKLHLESLHQCIFHRSLKADNMFHTHVTKLHIATATDCGNYNYHVSLLLIF